MAALNHTSMPPPGLQRMVRGRPDRRRVGHVSLEDEAASVMHLDIRFGSLMTSFSARYQTNGPAMRGEHNRRRPPYASRGACDHDRLPPWPPELMPHKMVNDLVP
jgi:hypothetical protein